MIRLDLTIQQADWLQQLLLDTSLDNETLAATLQAQLRHAYAHATTTQTCPVCNHAFTQLRAGRTGHYCSAACKQKAYRQRRNAWRRQLPTQLGPD